MSPEEALSACIAYGWSRAECEPEIRAGMVDGAYCDGTVVISAGGRRCVSSSTAARVDAARASSPLPVSSAPVGASGAPIGALVVGGVIAAGFLFWVWRRA